MIDRLMAKSWGPADGEPGDSIYLPVHLQDANAAAARLLEHTADAQLSALGLNPDLWRDRLCRIGTLAAALHDLGKANTHFQEMIRGTRSGSLQGLRHE